MLEKNSMEKNDHNTKTNNGSTESKLQQHTGNQVNEQCNTCLKATGQVSKFPLHGGFGGYSFPTQVSLIISG